MKDSQLALSFLDDKEDLLKILKKKTKKSKKFRYSLIFISIFIIFLIFFCIFFYKRNKRNNNQLERFYNSIPASLKSDSNGNFDLDRSGFNIISNSNKLYKPENFMVIFKTLSNQIAKMNGNMDASVLLDATIYHNEFNFKTEINEMISKSYESESYSFVAKIKIGSISFLSNNIQLTESFKDKIKTISNEKSYTNEEKAKNLDNLINLHGYYIPLKINFGGLFILDSQDIKNSEEEIKKLSGSLGTNLMNKNLDINLNYGNEVNNILNEFYSNSKKIIIGGDLKKDNFEDWKLSINEKNAEIINYDNIIKITDLLDEDIKIKLKVPLKLIDEKYEKRKNYYETVNKLKQIKKSGTIKRSGNGKFELGFDSNYNNLIYSQTRIIEKKCGWNEWTVTANEDISTNDIIVGIKVIPEKNKDGKWEIKENPLLNYEMSIKISSDSFNEINYQIIVYMMKLPD